MKNEAIRLIRKFYLFVFVALMVTVFLSGILTVWETGEYALNYREYATVSLRTRGDEMTVRFDGKEYSFPGIAEGKMALVRRALMYTPLSPILLILGDEGY